MNNEFSLEDCHISSWKLCWTVGLGFALFWLGYSHFYRRRNPYVGGVVSSLHFFPVKSCAGIDLNEAAVERLGFHLDRHWVLANGKGAFVSQRQFPKMALIQPSFNGSDFLCLDAPGMPQVKLNLAMEGNEQQKAIITIFGLTCEGYYCGDEISEWLSTFVGKAGLRLYSGHSKDLMRRKLTEEPFWGRNAKEGDEIFFHDCSPVMLLSEASLASANSHLQNAVTMKSFRPNIVVEGCRAYDEDSWKTILIGDVLLRKFRPCTRCVLTTVDPTSGTMSPNNEPLKTLKRVRMPADRDERCGDRPLFGNHFFVDQIGKIKIGDEILILK